MRYGCHLPQGGQIRNGDSEHRRRNCKPWQKSSLGEEKKKKEGGGQEWVIDRKIKWISL